VTTPDDKTRKGIRRTAIVLALLAITFYLGFILLEAIR